ncbi:gliomedin-like [Acropora muricata]|uniref:gliomedin-like n=1 Tax=Acropora muricata TaxID=159855 RepID=UPI0034E5B79A
MGLNCSRGPPGFRGTKGPQGHTGYNAMHPSSGASSVHGSSGPPGPTGPPGSPGTGNLSLCQYKNKREPAQTAGISADSVVSLREDEHKGWKIVGATCSTDGAAEYIFKDAVVDPKTNTSVYSCHCKGESSVFVAATNKMVCVIHYWICPIIS